MQNSSGLEKKLKVNEDDDSDSDEVVMSYKSKRSAMPDGPSDQGATSILVSIV